MYIFGVVTQLEGLALIWMCKHPNNRGRILAESPASTDTPCVIRTDTGVQRRPDSANIYIGVAKLLNFRPKSVYDKRGITSRIISKYFFFFLQDFLPTKCTAKVDVSSRWWRNESEACQTEVTGSKIVKRTSMLTTSSVGLHVQDGHQSSRSGGTDFENRWVKIRD